MKPKFKVLLDAMRSIFYDRDEYDWTANGVSIIVRLDDERRVKISLYETWCKDQYDAIKLSVVSKTHGNIDTVIVGFSDVFRFPRDMNHPNKIAKHIWKTDGHYEWYGVPTAEDLFILNKEIRNYISTWK